MKPEAHLAAERWMQKATSDLSACQILLDAEAPPLDVVCFHAQQAVEKAIKGTLTALGTPFPKTHDLAALSRLLPDDVSVAPRVEDQVELTRYAVELRYPDDYEEIEAALAVRLAAVAETTCAAARRWLDGHAPDDTLP